MGDDFIDEAVGLCLLSGHVVVPLGVTLDDLQRLTRPPAGGAALGVDRLAMVLLDAPDIDSVRAFLPPVGALW